MRYLFILILATIGSAAKATVRLPMLTGEDSRLVADTDTTVFRKSSVSLGASYGSDIQFFGRTGPVTYPFFSTDAIYNFKSGIFVYGSAFEVLGYTPLVDEVDLGAGYLFKYSKKFSGTISYTRFFFTKDAA